MWCKVFFTPWWVPLPPYGFRGISLGPFIFIREKYRGNVGLVTHEKIHVEQWYERKFTHGLRYIFSRRYRLECEAEAYAWSVFFLGSTESALDHYAHILATKYFLGITEEKAKDRIKYYMFATNFSRRI